LIVKTLPSTLETEIQCAKRLTTKRLSLTHVLFSTTLFVAGGALVSAQSLRSTISASDLVYRGAFAYPSGDAWAYSGHALCFYPHGDADGWIDGYPGSLYAGGLDVNRLVGEMSIPAPAISSSFGGLPTAVEEKSLADITDGWIDDCRYDPWCEYREVAGLEHLPQNGKIAWNLRDWYNVDGGDQDSLGWSNPDMTGAVGVWHIGPRLDIEYHNGKTSNYLFTAPSDFANLHLGGRSLIAGNHRPAGAFGGSQGPTMFALAPWTDGNPPSEGQDLDALALMYYREHLSCTNETPTGCDFPDYRVADDWAGGAWIDAGSQSTIIIAGIKGLGNNCYGTPGDTCPASACSTSQGWHSPPYEPQILFYDPDHILEVLAGIREPWEVVPVEIYSPTSVVFVPDCARLGAVAYDPSERLLYVAERQAGPWGETAVHVWEVTTLFTDDFKSGDLTTWDGVK
jgi:hypothetical protein